MNIPDISTQSSLHPYAIEEVGLQGIELPIKIKWGEKVQSTSARVDITISLDNPSQRGIHMSRLYLSLHECFEKHVITPLVLQELLEKCISSQKISSTKGRIKICWKGAIEKPALKTKYKGVQMYPCFYEIRKNNKDSKSSLEWTMGTEVLYSSTCPCSAALSRNLIQEQFQKEGQNLSYEEIVKWLGQESSMAGTPHAQRSVAFIQIKTQKEISFPKIIQEIEQTLTTHVQVAVKREDEKAFAHLNSQNLMYSEDAIRRIQGCLNQKKDIQDYWVKVRHIESLHPFDTIAICKKN